MPEPRRLAASRWMTTPVMIVAAVGLAIPAGAQSPRPTAPAQQGIAPVTRAVMAPAAGAAVTPAKPPMADRPNPKVATPLVINPPVLAPLPTVNLRPDQIALIQKTLAQADTHGLDHDALAPTAYARRDAASPLVAQILHYAIAVHSGRLPADGFMYEWGLRPAPYDPTPDFVQAVNTDRLAAWLDSLPPQYTGYDALRQSLAQYRALAQHGGWQPLPDLDDLKPGSTDPRVALLRARLAVEDSSVAATGPAVFDDGLTQAVMRAQKRYGLEPTGLVGKATLADLNVPVNDRVAQILANMERWRWLPSVLPADRIQVNIAAAVLTLFRNDAPALSMRAVTGRPGDETPMLQSVIQSIVLNPPWNVPSDIAMRELWPKEHAHPGYLARNDFIVIHLDGGGVRLQQKAGNKAALGHVKFDFVNKYGVYLHDTPTHGTFSKYTRQESHGCVRLERPVVLAKALLDGDPEWTADTIDEKIADGDTVRAPMQRPIAVFLLYWTAFAGPDGAANFRADPYHWDRALAQRMALAAHSGA
jgi:murein L,D-transpeptidase YcbB/YkuD